MIVKTKIYPFMQHALETILPVASPDKHRAEGISINTK
jgi:hypothetical protein